MSEQQQMKVEIHINEEGELNISSTTNVLMTVSILSQAISNISQDMIQVKIAEMKAQQEEEEQGVNEEEPATDVQ